MYCSNCGAQIPDDANFCSNCGRSQSPRPTKVKQEASVKEWEYWTWEAGVPSGLHIDSIKGKYGEKKTPEPYVRLQFWQKIQSRVLPVVQSLSDDGWESITEVGPAALILERPKVNFTNGADVFNFLLKDIIFADVGWKVYGLNIQFRRIKGSGKYSTNELPNLIAKAGY